MSAIEQHTDPLNATKALVSAAKLAVITCYSLSYLNFTYFYQHFSVGLDILIDYVTVIKYLYVFPHIITC